jgi:hypothetical protein
MPAAEQLDRPDAYGHCHIDRLSFANTIQNQDIAQHADVTTLYGKCDKKSQ